MDNNKDIEMATKPTRSTDNAASPKDSSEDRPPTPPKRDFKSVESSTGAETDANRRTRIFPRPEVIYKPESTKMWMPCLKVSLIIFNLLIWLFGAVLTGIGIWIKVDQDFWELVTGLDMKQFTHAGIILIVAGVIIMVIAFFGCYGAFAESLCMLILYAVFVVIIILLEVAVMALVWSAINNKDVEEHVKSKAKKAMQEMAKNDYQRDFLNLMQSRLKCCGVDGPDDYAEGGIPPSCTDPDTGFPFKKGCLETVVEYLNGKAGLLGGAAVVVLVFEVAALVLTLCVSCGIKNAASNAVF